MFNQFFIKNNYYYIVYKEFIIERYSNQKKIQVICRLTKRFSRLTFRFVQRQ